MATEKSLNDSFDSLAETVLAMKAERDSLKARMARYEACYSDIVAYIERANKDPNVGIPEMYEEVMELLDFAFCGEEKCR